MRSEAAELLTFCCWAPEWTQDGAPLTRPLFSIARGTAHRLTTRRLRVRTRKLDDLFAGQTGLAAMAGEEATEGGASVVVRARESRVQESPFNAIAHR
jgi:hypothetical protein